MKMEVPSPPKGSTVAPPPSPLVHAMSGAVGAVVAMALLYPLDQVRAILQVDDELARECAAPGGSGILGALSRIVRRHGRSGLWRGMVPVLITMGVSNFVYFYCFNGMKAALLFRRRRLRAPTPGAAKANGDIAAAAAAAAAAATASGARIGSGVLGRTAAQKPASAGGEPGGAEGGLTPLESVVASTIAGVINVMATTPLWVSNLRIKAGHGVGGLFSTLGAIGRHEGVAGLWSGAAPSLVLVSNPIIQFVAYEALKQAASRRHTQRQHVSVPPAAAAAAGGGSGGGGGGGRARGRGGRPSVGLPSHEAFLLGATAKAISTLVTYPLQLAQAKLRAGRAVQGPGQCRRDDDPDSPLETRTTRRGWRVGLAWQLLTCWSGTVDVLAKVCRQNGVKGMYQGMRAKLLHTVLTSALLFLGYERLLEVIATSMAAKIDAPVPPPQSPGSSTIAAAAASGARAHLPNTRSGSAAAVS